MRRPELTIEQILTWADRFYATHHRWPRRDDGRIAGSLGETWLAIDMALRNRGRGLSVRSSLPLLLHEHRGYRHRNHPPQLTIALILRWADDHFAKKGVWPGVHSGKVLAAPAEKWSQINRALICGTRGLHKGQTLAGLLAKARGVRRSHHLPHISKAQIIRWSIAYYRREGKWPTRNSGPIPEAPGETFGRLDTALVQGDREFSGGSSLAKLLAQYGKHRNRKALPKLRVAKILQWADEFIRKHGRWPTHLSGPIPNSGGETWGGVHAALYQGYRGFTGGSSLFQFLKEHRIGPKAIRRLQRSRKLLRKVS